jgi:signal peptidase I
MASKSVGGKIWYFIWEDDSVWSWIVNVILAFILIKFIIYPGLGFIFQTSHPIVAVVSGSMEHKMVPAGSSYVICSKSFSEKQGVNLDKFWEICGNYYETNFAITKDKFKEYPFKNGFNKGDIMVLYSAKQLKPGEVVVYNGAKFPIIHRIVQLEGQSPDRKLVTAGDHNGYKDPQITEDRVIGKAVLRIPYLGYIKIWFVELICLFNHNFQFCSI